MIIDGHSHIGKDYYFGGNDLGNYDEYCKQNKIDIGLLMPMPWPVLESDENELCSLIWEYNKFMNYYKITCDKKQIIDKNPYENINFYYYNQILNTKTNTIIHFVPLIHGVLDDSYYVENLIKTMNPIAVKFHGFASGFFCDDVKSDIIDILRFYEMPIILHTSVYNYNYGYGADTKYFRNKCSPSSWLSFLEKNNLKGVLNHGACLDEEVINKVNKNDNIMIGIGPDLDISLDYYKVLTKKDTFLNKGYLNLLKEKADINKLVFDVDYNWNVNELGKIDNDFYDRISRVFKDSEMDKIFYDNALSFYKKIK